MTDYTEMLHQLKRPFPVDRVHWRIGATNVTKEGGIKWGKVPQGQAMCYIDARDVMRRLDDVFPMQWQDRYSHAGGGIFVCEIGVKVGDEWLWRSNGAGETQFEAEKGGMSDAFKRAAIMWGIGQYLYKIPSQWVNIHEKGKDWAINEPPVLPKWATPEGYDEIVLNRKPCTEAEVHRYHELVKAGDALGLFEFFLEMDEQQKEFLLKSFEIDKTAMKRRSGELISEGREKMLNMTVDLASCLDSGDNYGVDEIIESVSGKLLEVMRNNMNTEHLIKLDLIREAA